MLDSSVFILYFAHDNSIQFSLVIDDARVRNFNIVYGPTDAKPPIETDVEDYQPDTPELREKAIEVLRAVARVRGGSLASVDNLMSRGTASSKLTDSNDEGAEDYQSHEHTTTLQKSATRLAARSPDAVQVPSMDVKKEKRLALKQAKLYANMGLKPLQESEMVPLLFNKETYSAAVTVEINGIVRTYIPFDDVRALAKNAGTPIRNDCKYYNQEGRTYKQLHKFDVFDGYANIKEKVFV